MGSVMTTAPRLNGLGTRKRSQDRRTQARLVPAAVGTTGTPVIAARSTTPSCTSYTGPLGPSGVMAMLWPSRPSRMSAFNDDIAPREVDLGWMCFLHSFFEFLLGQGGIDGLPDLLRPRDVASTYRELTGIDVGDLRWSQIYAGLRHGIVMARIHLRQIHFEGAEWPDDPDQTFMFADLLNAMLDGTAWD